MTGGGRTTLFVCGDVMTGRGVDQVLPHPSPPHLYEPYMRSALDYVALAEKANGPIPRPVDPDYVWGTALQILADVSPHARVINLETSVTTSDTAETKGINYRTHPDHVAVLTAARIDCCVLANNHVLDWGQTGLLETLDTLARADIRFAARDGIFGRRRRRLSSRRAMAAECSCSPSGSWTAESPEAGAPVWPSRVSTCFPTSPTMRSTGSLGS